jgi:MFS family permease
VRSRIYYGWAIVLLAAAAMVGTLPGRTQGLGLITEPLLRDLRLDRVTYASLNFWATIAGAVGALGIGRAIDRFGSRGVLTLVTLLLGVIVAAMSAVTSVAALAVFLTATRLIGQSALSVVSIAMVGQWFVRRLDGAMAIYSVLLSVALTRLMAIAMFVLAAGLAALPHLASQRAVMTWAAVMGLGGGLVMVLFFSVWPRVYGRRHLGQIQGIAQAMTVFASAIGPLLLAWCVDLTGSYAAMFRILSGSILLVALTSLVVDLPRPVARAIASEGAT